MLYAFCSARANREVLTASNEIDWNLWGCQVLFWWTCNMSREYQEERHRSLGWGKTRPPSLMACGLKTWWKILMPSNGKENERVRSMIQNEILYTELCRQACKIWGMNGMPKQLKRLLFHWTEKASTVNEHPELKGFQNLSCQPNVRLGACDDLS